MSNASIINGKRKYFQQAMKVLAFFVLSHQTTNVYAFSLYLKENCAQGWRTW